MTGESLPGVLLVAAIFAVLIWRANRKTEQLLARDRADLQQAYLASGFADHERTQEYLDWLEANGLTG